ncbi:hypothetical protein R3P38DRAFT_3193076 [Favolaschia claudopus]|uniref:Uncharacterized protein n=1 Tax=Favolaschia claudopus TaxID=2862362 RepID=A0AAW0BGZ4_9AGAR
MYDSRLKSADLLLYRVSLDVLSCFQTQIIYRRLRLPSPSPSPAAEAVVAGPTVNVGGWNFPATTNESPTSAPTSSPASAAPSIPVNNPFRRSELFSAFTRRPSLPAGSAPVGEMFSYPPPKRSPSVNQRNTWAARAALSSIVDTEKQKKTHTNAPSQPGSIIPATPTSSVPAPSPSPNPSPSPPPSPSPNLPPVIPASRPAARAPKTSNVSASAKEAAGALGCFSFLLTVFPAYSPLKPAHLAIRCNNPEKN